MTDTPTAPAAVGATIRVRRRFGWAVARETVLAAGLAWIAKCLCIGPSNFARWPAWYRLPQELHLDEATLGTVGAASAGLILLGLLAQAWRRMRGAGCWMRAAGLAGGVYPYGILGASFLLASRESVAVAGLLVAAASCAAAALSWPERPEER